MMISLIVVVCFIFLAFVFFDIFSTYAYKNASQNAADAAAVAAASEAKDIYEEELAERLEQEFAPFATRIRDAIRNDEEDDDDDDEAEANAVEEGSEEEPEEDAPSEDEQLREEAENRDAPDEVIDKIIDATVPLTNEALFFFFTDEEITSMMCGAIKNNWSDIEDKANYFAQKNGAEEVAEMEFPYGGSFEIFVSVDTETTFITVPDEAFAPGERDMRTEASAGIPILEGVQFQSGSCNE
ncbi:Putative Flp pilus-assembly TadE/G-like [Alteribacillus persepolensis]|uniref:Putative Flp pilus-assembly TadE/G-like n=1 Tax=Alteribacillus persepolensis TaxID=568899 RepID=A0A1G8EYB3_9BACI|nr:pilus assembly protein TadG-related protein [Alteribacillus persepolensis]SDH74888.1 Putative Flp pilus-assembly TadE/G-like [Alteribacillus persepolensis]